MSFRRTTTSSAGRVVRGLGQDAVQSGRNRHESEVAPEPGGRPTWPVEDEGTERSREGPKRDGPRFHEPPEAPLEQEGEHEPHRDLGCAEDRVALRPGEHGEADERRDLVGERDQGRDPEAERGIGRDPDERENGDQQRRQDERRLAQTLLRSVGGQRPNRRDPFDRRSPPGANAHTEDSRTPAATSEASQVPGRDLSFPGRWRRAWVRCRPQTVKSQHVGLDFARGRPSRERSEP
jgi:hypothetical protein